MAEMAARLDHVGLAVAGLEAAAAWFCDVFGLVPELSLRVDAIDLSIEMLIHPEFGYRLELLHRPGRNADDMTGAAGKPATPPRRPGARGTGTWRSTSPTSTAPTTAPSPAGRGRSCRRARRRNRGCGWRSSPTPRATSSNFCTGQGGSSEPNPADGYTGGSWTLTTAERPPCTTASASFSTWGSSAGSDTVTP